MKQVVFISFVLGIVFFLFSCNDEKVAQVQKKWCIKNIEYNNDKVDSTSMDLLSIYVLNASKEFEPTYLIFTTDSVFLLSENEILIRSTIEYLDSPEGLFNVLIDKNKKGEIKIEGKKYLSVNGATYYLEDCQ